MMKKIFAMLLALSMLTLCACCAWAEPVTIAGEALKGTDVSGTGWRWDGGTSLLTINQAGEYTIKDWDAQDASIIVDNGVTGAVTLNLENVKLSTNSGVLMERTSSGVLTVNLDKDSHLQLSYGSVISVFANNGDVTVDVSGEGTITGGTCGIIATAFDGDITVNVSGAKIMTTGDYGAGIAASAPNGGGVTVVNVSGAEIVTEGKDNDGIAATAYVGTVKVNVNGTKITAKGKLGDGIFACGGGGDVTVDVSGTEIMATGDDSAGIYAYDDTGRGCDVTLNVSGTEITATGDDSAGIYAYDVKGGGCDVTLNVSGTEITATGNNGKGITTNDYVAATVTLGSDVMVNASGSGNSCAVHLPNNSSTLRINGKTYPGIALSAGEDEGSAQVSGVYNGLSGNVYSNVDGKRYIRTQWDDQQGAAGGMGEIADLPKTGDSSRLALWLLLVAVSGAAMLMLRRRAHN